MDLRTHHSTLTTISTEELWPIPRLDSHATPSGDSLSGHSRSVDDCLHRVKHFCRSRQLFLPVRIHAAHHQTLQFSETVLGFSAPHRPHRRNARFAEGYFQDAIVFLSVMSR
jgi:hypothetical protein